MDGYDLIKTIRESEKTSGEHLPVIVLTADIHVAKPQAFLELGFDECLLKPVSLGQFRRLLIRLGILRETDEDRFVPRLKSEAEQISAAISMPAIISQMGAFDDSAKEMLSVFASLTEPLLLKLRKSVKARKYAETRHLAHSIKGAAYSACAMRLGNIAAKIQNAAELNKDSHELVEDLFVEFDHARQAIEELIRPSKT
jgi:CheY-like chemotaxis protein